MVEPIRILIVDDHALVRKGLRALLEGKPDLTVVGEATDGQEVVRQVCDLQPDVVLLDLVMPHQDGLTVLPEIRRESPETRVLVLTSFGEDERIFAAIKAGALGYLLKDALPEELVQAIRAVYRGECSLSPSIALKVVRELDSSSSSVTNKDSLTKREVEVLKLLAKGLSNREIGEQLSISERTVGVHVSHILGKLQLANRVQAALYAIRAGVTTLDETEPP
jgi:NarL family two-component system response regulator LiaR